MRKLTARQRAFVSAYLGAAHGNGMEAARIAGYKDPQQSAHDNRTNLDIAAEIERHYAENGMAADEILSRFADEGRGVGAYLKIEDKRLVVDVERLLADGKGHLVKSITDTAHGQRIEFYDAQFAKDRLGRMQRLFADDDQDKPRVNINLVNIMLDALPYEFRDRVLSAIEAEFSLEPLARDRALAPPDPDHRSADQDEK